MPGKRKDKSPSVNRVLITSFLVDITDVILNVIVAIISGSVVMLSQALQGGSDLIASGMLIIGLKRSNRPSDKNYPFGYGRELYFWTMMAAIVMLGVTATMSFYFGFRRFINPEPIDNIFVAYFVLTFGFVTNAYAAFLSYKRLIGKKDIKKILNIFTNSPLIETKTAFVLDLMGTFAAVLGLAALIIFQITGDFRFDGLGAMSIGIMLAILSIFLIDGIKDMVVGRSASIETQNKIKKSALKIKDVQSVPDMKTMYIGPGKLLVNLEVNIKRGMNTAEIEQTTDKIKSSVKRDTPSVKHIQVEIEDI